MSDAKTDVRLWRAPELGAQLLRGRFRGFSYDMHSHDTACFALITHGAIRIRMRGTEFIARQGDLYAIEADEAHAGWAVDDEGWRQRTLYVDSSRLRGLLGDTSNTALSLQGPLIRDATLTALFHGVHHCSDVQGAALKRETQYVRFAQRLLSRHVGARAPAAAAGREPRAIRIARCFLDENIDRTVHLDDIAKAVDLPVFTLFRAFERHLGVTPHGYQRQARLRAAQRLIQTGHALSAVAASAGYADQAHLTRAFKRALGVTPAVYRKALQG
ncbi:helix-turn-helix transcriptional regulator [Chitinasiproducens palmae]|uniref:AraC-type DNA-binding protein n=1 Tax=Chitinasiproducens palmae TaxID=1770053 RepID=A0A1H2PLK5_9BURK|nr:AraC family transcriptional regulator [Chitinasiproducens palmae]SDV46911.1 AraC-type DNA-binding protein [Chitinasiproducens palmae]